MRSQARATAFLNAVELSTSHKLAELGMPIRLRWEVTSGFAEAQYEWKAVEYAVRQSGLGQPSLILSGGKGSVQVTGLDASFSFSAPLGNGEAFVKQHAGARSAGVAACEQFYQETMPVDKTLTTLFSQALENADEATIRVVAISGFYYAALAAKLIVKDAPKYQYLNASTIAESLVAMRNAEETKPADVAAAVCFHLLLPATLRTVGCNPMHPGCNRFSFLCIQAATLCIQVRFHQLLHKLFDARHLHKVEILFARDWKLGSGATQTPYRTTWAAGWWIDQVSEMFASDISPDTDKSLARHTVLTQQELQQELRVYESELRLACRVRGKGGELLEPSALDSLVEIRAYHGAAATSSARDVVEATRAGRPLVLYHGGGGHRTVLPKLLKAASIAATLVPLLVPVEELVATTTPTRTQPAVPLPRPLTPIWSMITHQHY